MRGFFSGSLLPPLPPLLFRTTTPAMRANTPSAASPIPRNVLALGSELLSSLADFDLDEDEPEDEDEDEFEDGVSVLGVLLLGVGGVVLSGVFPVGCSAAGGFVPEPL